jgi:GT2 family glycosyltransferase
VIEPELSVIIPTFGRPLEVRRAVASALVQDVPLEVIVVDDGSPEPLPGFGDERVVIQRQSRNLGAAAARNHGARHARGAWLAFLDSDDVWPTGSLRERLDAARSAGADANIIWVSGFEDVWPNGRRRVRIPKESDVLEDYVSGCWGCPGSTALMSRSSWEKSGGQDENLRRLEDYDWLIRWIELGARVAVHPSVGAEIARGGRGSPEAIVQAAAYLLKKHSALAKALTTRMESYLNLEIGVACLHAGAMASGASALAKSWLLHPRLQPSLEHFWKRG